MDLLLLARSEVILDVEGLTNLLGSLALDHVGDSLAGYVQQALNKEGVNVIHKCIRSKRTAMMSEGGVSKL